MKRLLICLFFIIITANSAIAETSIPRTVLALYDGRNEKILHTRIHRYTEMPLNHLGLVIEYHDINKPLPSLENMKHIRGVFSWFEGDYMTDPVKYEKWAEKVIDSGKKFVVFGETGVAANNFLVETPHNVRRRFLRKLGLKSNFDWINVTYKYHTVKKVSEMVEFEKPMKGIFPAFMQIEPLDKNNAESFLVIADKSNPDDRTHLVMVTDKGGYAAAGYIFYYSEKLNQKQWYLNPFAFFRKAFDTDDIPKPDITTMSGRRIYYSHVDGDGWNNVTEISEYKRKRIISAKVIFEKIYKEYKDLPVTVAPIAGDIDIEWKGLESSLPVMKEILELPYIEAGTHTYSHPFNWSFYIDYKPEKEAEFTGRKGLFHKQNQPVINEGGYQHNHEHSMPRAYFKKPFDLDFEINGSVSFFEKHMPKGKKVKVIQWSGDTTPYEEAIAVAKKAGLANINGGDSRFDNEYPSNIWVSSLGRRVGKQIQIYASNSNENTYTDLWTDRYFGFKHLVSTIKNTETPIRLKPFNVYYHMYSGQKLSSLNALISNLEYARKQKITPVTTSEYAFIGQGFFTAEITALEKDVWQIKNRGKLQTIRFDKAAFKVIDFEKSKGIIGQTHLQGSLYIALDENENSPIIAIKEYDDYSSYPLEKAPYLIDARWHVWGLKHNQNNFEFMTKGFGKGEMTWKVPERGTYEITFTKKDASKSEITNTFDVITDKNNLLSFSAGDEAINTAIVSVKKR